MKSMRQMRNIHRWVTNQQMSLASVKRTAQNLVMMFPGSKEQTSSRLASLIILALSFAYFGLTRQTCINIPLERDEGEYAYFAQNALLGAEPYRDMFNQKPPGTFLTYMIPVAFYGTSIPPIRITMYAFTIGAAIFVYLIAHNIYGALSGAIAVFVFFLITGEPSLHATAANTEQFMLLPMTAALWCAMRARSSGQSLWWATCGALSLLACGFKQVAATNALVLAAAVWPTKARSGEAKAARNLAAWVVGFMGVLVAGFSYFASRGTLEEFLDAVLLHNLKYVRETTWTDGFGTLCLQLESQLPSFWPVWALSCIGIWQLIRNPANSGMLVLGWLAASAAAVTIGLRFYPHYFLQLAPGLAIASGAGLVCLFEWISAIVCRWAFLATFTLVVAIGAIPIARHWNFYFTFSPTEQSWYLYSTNPFDISADVAHCIREKSARDDRVLIFGSEPQILFLANRRSASRYIIFYPLMVSGELGLRRQKEVWKEIQSTRPSLILMTDMYTSLLESPASPTYLRQRVATLLDQSYELQAVRFHEGSYAFVCENSIASLSPLIRSKAHARMDMYLYARRDLADKSGSSMLLQNSSDR